MPDVTAYSAIATVDPADVLPIVDVTDTTMGPAGTTKKITVAQLAAAGSGGSGYAPLAGAQFTGYVAPAVVALSYAATITINASQGNDFRVTLAGSPAFAAPLSPQDGQTIQVWLTQDSAGSRTVTWNAVFSFGSGGAPVLSTAAGATDVVGFTWNAATSIWRFLGSTTGGGSGGGIGVTLSGTPAAGQAPVAISGTAAEWLAPSGTRPEAFGTITGVSGDQAALSAAITAISTGAAPPPLVLTQKYALDSTVTLAPGVNVVCSGQGNRQNGLPDTFAGGFICPSALFPTGSATPLLAIGATGTPGANPCGITLDGLCMSGQTANSTVGSPVYASNAIGVLGTDTADIHMTNCYFGNFDRPGGTGTCVQLASATAGNGVGFEAHGCVFSASQAGIYGDGAGVTDIRVIGGLFHACTENLTLGPTAGGGGLQLTGAHFTYTGSPSTGWHLSLGSQAGDYQITGNYFDQDGSAVSVQLANDKGVFNSNHFLAASTSTAVSLVKVSVSAPAELSFQGNHANLNGSSVTALLQTSAHAGIPAGGRWDGNVTFGAGGSFISALTDSASSPIPQITQAPGGTSTFLRADGTWVNPSVTSGTVSGSLIATPVVYAPGSVTALTVSSATLSAFSSASVNTGSFTAPASGTVVVTVTFMATPAANQNYSFALAAHGTVSPVLSNTITCETSSGNQKIPHSLTFIVGSLTPSSSYSMDLLGAIASGSLSIQALGSSSTTPTGTIGAPVTIVVAAV